MCRALQPHGTHCWVLLVCYHLHLKIFSAGTREGQRAASFTRSISETAMAREAVLGYRWGDVMATDSTLSVPWGLFYPVRNLEF